MCATSPRTYECGCADDNADFRRVRVGLARLPETESDEHNHEEQENAAVTNVEPMFPRKAEKRTCPLGIREGPLLEQRRIYEAVGRGNGRR